MIILILILLGLVWGSFVNAWVWRIHEQDQLKSKKTKSGKQRLSELSIIKGRSICPNCRHKLEVVDLMPVFSWLFLKGKCRYCYRPISWQYPLVELTTSVLFVMSYIYWPSSFHGAGLLEFILWLGFLVCFMALAIYDLRWFILPNRIVYPLIFIASLQVLIVSIFYNSGLTLILGSFWGLLIGGGLFYILFQISSGKWIGGGDVKLGALLGIIIGGPLLSCLMLFSASLLGTLVSLPLLISGKVSRNTQIPFGPFLLIATIITRLFGASIIVWLRSKSFLPPN